MTTPVNEREYSERAIAVIRAVFADVPTSAYQVETDLFGPDIAQGDDYRLLWDFQAIPSNPHSCPISLMVTEKGNVGFGFDRYHVRAKILGLKGTWGSEDWFVFGHEPISLPIVDVVSLLQSVVRGGCELRYRSFAGYLTSAWGEVTIAGVRKVIPGIRPVPIGWPLRTYKYHAWK